MLTGVQTTVLPPNQHTSHCLLPGCIALLLACFVSLLVVLTIQYVSVVVLFFYPGEAFVCMYVCIKRTHDFLQCFLHIHQLLFA